MDPCREWFVVEMRTLAATIAACVAKALGAGTLSCRASTYISQTEKALLGIAQVPP